MQKKINLVKVPNLDKVEVAKENQVVKKIIFLSVLLAGTSFSRPVQVTSTNTAGGMWKVPFASKENTISLTVRNSSTLVAKDVYVRFDDLPSWLNFRSSAFQIRSIPAQGSADVGFTFSVDKKAPVGRDTTITATISTANGRSWTKEIRISVSAPKDYRLYDNFPNPFNPSTKIAFELPKAARVRVAIYDVIGREVAQLTDADYPAGYTELAWNGLNSQGRRVSSGIYFCRMSTGRWSAVKKMMMIK